MIPLQLQGENQMQYPEDTDKTEDQEDNRRLILDGTANLDYAEDEQVPRVKGLIELLNDFFGKNPGGSEKK